MNDESNNRPRATWVAVLGLVSTAAVAFGCGAIEGSPSYPEGHPCNDLGPCEMFVELPDGGAVADPGPDAGLEGPRRMCGACNG